MHTAQEHASLEVVVSNRFQPFQELDLAPDPESGGIDEHQGTLLASSPQKRELVIVGDSIIRGIDSLVCSRDKESRTVCCLPGILCVQAPGQISEGM